VTDGPSAIDPLVAEGPRAPVDSLRPAVSQQRRLLFDGPTLMMVDLAAGNVRPYENGPPVSVPMSSAPFDLAMYDRLQVQLLRGPRPTSTSMTHLSLRLGRAERAIDVSETPDGELVVAHGDVTERGAIGQSPAIVVVIEHTKSEGGHEVAVSARNAETMDGPRLLVAAVLVDIASLTIGGPAFDVTGNRGIRRTTPVQIEVTAHREPVDQVRRVVGAARRAAGSLRDRTR